MKHIPADSRLALFMEGELATASGKLGVGVLRYSSIQTAAVIDSANAGRSLQSALGLDHPAPIVASLAEARALGADVLVLGIAPPGGVIPPTWEPMLADAVALGFSIVNGLHSRAAPLAGELPLGQWVWDVREEPAGLATAKGLVRHMSTPRVLFVGTDMSVGKMTAGLEMHHAAQAAGLDSRFVATGQTGMIICGSGVPLDSVRVDFAPGAVEAEVLRGDGADVIFVEGQGSLVHPFSSATLALMRGSVPTHLVMCHRAGMSVLPRADWVYLPPLSEVIRLNEELACGAGAFPRPKTAAVALNTFHLSVEEADRACAEIEDEVGLPCCDPVRHGAHRLVEALALNPKGQ